MRLKGKSLQARVNSKTIALATSCTFNTTTQTSDSRTKDDAVGPHVDIEYVDWNLSSENLAGANKNVTGQMLYSQLLELQLSHTLVDLSVDLVKDYSGEVPDTDWQPDTERMNTGFIPHGGKAYIESVSLTAPETGNATVSVSFKAAGALKKITNA